MTYSGTMTNVFTLAHELGHAYHSYEVRNLPILAQEYRMNVAETASTLAEMTVIDALIQREQDPTVQRSLLDHKLQRSTIFLMNIYARFLFELDFYEARKKGYVVAEDLNAMMTEAQKKAYGNALSEWHSRFWISKQHFYMTSLPFYNFPYTFGYLFSLGIYSTLKKEKNRAEAWAALLRDTGRLSVEDLAQRHLGVNLENPAFWEEAINTVEVDVERFIQLT